LAPATEPSKHTVPFAEHFWQVTPRCPGADNPENPFHKHPVIASRRAALVRTANNQNRDTVPLLVTQNEPIE